MNKEITIQRAWLEGLYDIASRVSLSQGNNRETNIAHLLGYIKSVDYLLDK